MRVAKHQFSISALRINPKTLQRAPFPQETGRDLVAQLQTVQRALSFSPLWTEMPRASIVVRQGSDPLLGIIGYFDAADEARLEALQWQLHHLLPRLRYIGYARAEEDCERLAERLVERFGREELRDFRFAAMPRGGFVVLGMLAYVLGLQRSQLDPPHPTDAPLVVVDDCTISGVRFGQFLERIENPSIVFAHLYSPPESREAIEDREAGRVTCLGAHDLHDHARENLGEEYPAWRERWMERMDRRGYWVGQPEHVCFAWNEPDFGFWNPVTGREETGWRFVPPELCLKNRPAPGQEPVPVQIQSQGVGSLKPSAHTLFGEFEGGVAIGNLKTGESFMLDGAGADMWRAIVEHGEVERAAAALLGTYEVDASILIADLREFVDDLLSQDLLKKDG